MAACVGSTRRMEFKVSRLWLVLALLGACAPALADITVVDDTGRTLHLAQPARRIVSLAPHVTETLFAIGAGSRIVGTVDFSNYPEAAKKIARVGGYSQLDLEAIVALKPDLLVVWESGNVSAHIEKLRQLGLPIYVTQPNHLEDLPGTLERLARLAGTEEAGQRAVARMRQRLEQLHRRYAKQPKVRTFYQIWKQPLMTVGGQQIISDVIALCGGENVFASLGKMASNVSIEAVVASNPEVIVASGMGEERPEWLDDWRRWTEMTAVRRNNLFFVHPDIIQRHTPRLLDGAERLCQQLEIARSRRPAK